jgi:hypothetical protein
MGGVLYGLIATSIFFVVCTIIGAFFVNTGGFDIHNAVDKDDNLIVGGFDKTTAGIFSLTDIVSN